MRIYYLFLLPFKLFISCSFLPFCVLCYWVYLYYAKKFNQSFDSEKQVQNTKKKSKLGKDLKLVVSL